jgi:hypothetical protein
LAPQVGLEPANFGCQPAEINCARPQRDEFARGNDSRALAPPQGEQPALVARYQVVGLARLAQGQQKIVGRIRRALDARQGADGLGKVLQIVDQAASLVGLDARGDRGLVQRGLQLVKLLCADQEPEMSFLPGAIDRDRVPQLNREGGNQDVGIQHHTHQALPALPLARRSARTSLTVASMRAGSSLGSAPALRALMS